MMTRKLKIKMKYYGYEFNLEKDIKFSKGISTIIEELLFGHMFVDVEIGPRDSAKDDSLKLTYCPSSYAMATTSSEIEQAGKRFAESVGWLLKKLEESTELKDGEEYES